MAGTEPDKHLLDLQDAIKAGDSLSWDVYVQVIRPEEIEKAPINIFDMTKVWPKKLYPLRKMGRVTLDKNPDNWFAEIEQAAFSPSNMVPGIGPSPDPMLQARMFAYPDAARYRLGVNYQFLPTNAPTSNVYCPIERDGFMNFTRNYGGDPNYIGTQIKPCKFTERQSSMPISEVKALEKPSQTRTADQAQIGLPVSAFTEVTDKDFEQATALWNIMSRQDRAQERFINNLAAHVSGVTEHGIRQRVYEMFARVDPVLGKNVGKVTETKIAGTHAHPHRTAWH